MKKVVFCFYTNDHEVNLGIGFMSAALKRRGIATDLVIYRDVVGKGTDSPQDVASRILAKEPSVVAFSAMTFNWAPISGVITLLRQSYDGLIVVGGYQAILDPEAVLANPGVDGVCVGEGELPLIMTAEGYEVGKKTAVPIPGMVFKTQEDREDALRHPWLVEDLEAYPYIDYDIFAAECEKGLDKMHIGNLWPGGIYSLPVITGRGCPYRCTYCSNHALIQKYGGVKNYLRKYGRDAAISGIKALVAKHDPEMIEFFDETFVRNKAWVRDFCRAYKEEIGLPYMIMARIDSLDEETVSVLAESGLKLILFGLESGDEEYRARFLNRKMSDETIKVGARLLRNYGIMVATFNMFGMPFETKQTMQKTFDLNKALDPDVAYAFIFQPLPGTELARVAEQHHLTVSRSKERWDLQSPSLDTAELPASYVAEFTDRFRAEFSNQQRAERYYGRLRKCAKGLRAD